MTRPVINALPPQSGKLSDGACHVVRVLSRSDVFVELDQLLPGHCDADRGLRVWGLGPTCVTLRPRRFVDCFKRRFQPNTNLKQRIINLVSYVEKGEIKKEEASNKANITVG